MARLLFHFPIVHHSREMGFTNNEALDSALQSYWNEIDSYLHRAVSDFSKALVFQDSLPILEDSLMEKWLETSPETPNYNTLKKLVKEGARLIGGENLDATSEQYDLARKAQEDKWTLDKYKSVAVPLLTRRDRFMAKSIDGNLTSENFGILFMGMAHRVQDYLPEDIIISGFTLEPQEGKNEIYPDSRRGKERE